MISLSPNDYIRLFHLNQHTSRPHQPSSPSNYYHPLQQRTNHIFESLEYLFAILTFFRKASGSYMGVLMGEKIGASAWLGCFGWNGQRQGLFYHHRTFASGRLQGGAFVTATRQIFGHLYLEKSPIFTSVCYCIVVGELNVVCLARVEEACHLCHQARYSTCMYIHSSHASTAIGTLRRSYSGNPNIGARSGPMPVNAQHAYRGEAHPHGIDEAGRGELFRLETASISLALVHQNTGREAAIVPSNRFLSTHITLLRSYNERHRRPQLPPRDFTKRMQR